MLVRLDERRIELVSSGGWLLKSSLHHELQKESVRQFGMTSWKVENRGDIVRLDVRRVVAVVFVTAVVTAGVPGKDMLLCLATRGVVVERSARAERDAPDTRPNNDNSNYNTELPLEFIFLDKFLKLPKTFWQFLERLALKDSVD